MYTRSYNDTGEILIPERYGGTSFGQSHPSHNQPQEPELTPKNPWENEKVHTSEDESVEESAPTSASPSKLSLGGIFGNIFKKESFSLQKLGKEELLIIATAAFLFFSKEGDKECAIMLLLLLFLG